MSANRRYWLFVALVFSAVVVAFYYGLPATVYALFPDAIVRIVSAAVLASFAYVLLVIGGGTAAQIASYDQVLLQWRRGDPVSRGNAAGALLMDASRLHAAGARRGQRDFEVLYDRIREKFDSAAEAGIERIDSARTLFFFVGIFFTIVGIVSGFASLGYPTTPEESKLMSFGIIKGLGVAYMTAASCIGSALVLFVASGILRSGQVDVSNRFADAAYDVVILGSAVRHVVETGTETGGEHVVPAE